MPCAGLPAQRVARLVPHLVRLGISGIGRSIREATAITYEGTAALAAQRRSRHGLAELERAVATLEEAVADGADEDIIRADRGFYHTVAALTGSLALELIVSDFYRPSTRHSTPAAG